MGGVGGQFPRNVLRSNNLILWSRLWLDTQLFFNVYLDINSANMSSSKELNLMLFCIAMQDKYL